MRGNHANKDSHFILVCVKGSCKVLVNDGENQAKFTLDSPKKALYLNKMVWKEMYDFSKDAILLVLTNTLYNENEYIRSFEDFLVLVNSKKDTK